MTPKSYRALQRRARVPRCYIPAPLNLRGWALPQGCPAGRALRIAAGLRCEGNHFEARQWVAVARDRRLAGRVKHIP